VTRRGGPVTVSVPATSANLGPGFDAMGLALALYDVVEARVLDAGLVIEVSGAGRQPEGAGEDHLVIRAMRAAFAWLGGQPPGIGIRCVNAIPQGYGLGSSAGAIVAGLLAARALSPGGTASPGNAVLSDEAVLRMAAQLEGHPDNAAACLAGGLTIAWQSASGIRAARLSPLPGLAPVLCVPAVPLATEAARQVLPAVVPHGYAAANSARAALLVAALTGKPELLMDGTQDFLHQSYRTVAMPDTMRLVSRLRAAGIPAVVSGGGPSVLALAVTGTHPGPDAVAAITGEADGDWQVLPLDVDQQGAVVRPAWQP
jgi:homoserine kinase